MVDAKSVPPGLVRTALSPCLEESLSSLFLVMSSSSLCLSMSLAFFSLVEFVSGFLLSSSRSLSSPCLFSSGGSASFPIAFAGKSIFVCFRGFSSRISSERFRLELEWSRD